MGKLRDKVHDYAFVVLGLAIIYLLLASTVWEIRHPWATRMEFALNIHKVLLFQKVNYWDLRPREPDDGS